MRSSGRRPFDVLDYGSAAVQIGAMATNVVLALVLWLVRRTNQMSRPKQMNLPGANQ